ncbi:TonB-dependent receptor [Pseudomonas qingdaonensis]|nr:TonB-dependent receptor [Pseudomonas qingdaonensis]
MADFGRTDIDQKTDSFALFGSSTWQATDDLSFTAGLRWTRETKDIDLRRVAAPDAASVDFSNRNDWWKHYSGPLATTVVQDEKRTWNKLTYDFTPEYQLNDNARVYFRYAKGFRSGGFSGGAQVQAEASVVAPENVDAYELGVKSEWFDERLIANANVFYYDYSDIQVNAVSVRNGQVVSLLTNSGQGVIRGAEFELQALPLANLELHGSLGLLHTELQDFESGVWTTRATALHVRRRARWRWGQLSHCAGERRRHHPGHRLALPEPDLLSAHRAGRPQRVAGWLHIGQCQRHVPCGRAI